MLTKEDKYKFLYDETEWNYIHRNRIYSMFKNIQKLNGSTCSEIKSDFYMKIMDKNIRHKNALVLSLYRYCIDICRKLKNKNKTYRFDKFEYEKYYEDKFNKFNFSIDEKRYLAFFNARYICGYRIKPQSLGLFSLLKEKGMNKNEDRKLYYLNVNKNFKMMMLIIIQLKNEIDQSLITNKDKVLISYCKDYLSNFNNMQIYYGKLDIFDGRDVYAKDHKITHLCRDLLRKIYTSI